MAGQPTHLRPLNAPQQQPKPATCSCEWIDRFGEPGKMPRTAGRGLCRRYEGQAFLHPLLRDIVAILAPDDDLLTIVSIVIESSGVLTGHYGGVEAQEARKALVADWANDDRQVVRDFAISFAKTADNSIAFERRRADQDVAMQDLSWNK